MAITDDELLRMVAEERRQSIGFDHDAELFSAREQALNYAKGEMPDVPALKGRSKAVSTDVSDAIETALPDLIEVFTGDDVVVFPPAGPEDEEQARLETDYVNHVFWNENDGFMVLYAKIKDALQSKIGIVTWWWEEYEDVQSETSEPLDLETAAVARFEAEQAGYEVEVADNEDGSVTLTAKRSHTSGCCKIMAVPPEDFTVARDAVSVKDATYCAMRSRPRAQDLIADGYDPEQVAKLPPYGSNRDEGIDLARDTAGESDEFTNGSTGDLRTVEIVAHFIRVLEGDKLVFYRVVTGADETVLLEKEQVKAPQFAVSTPYPVTHRLYGRSLADLLLEVQRIKTALLRMFLDSGYFALNQRQEVAMDRANQFTISDLLRNEPGVPVRSKSGDAIRPITAGGLTFDAVGALEFMSTVAEQRTGIVRNAQGLNPDTLHDTAQGAQILIGAAQKRLRLIARIFAETGIKDMFVGIHATIKANAKNTSKALLRGQWAEVDPSKWRDRKDMNVEVGVGAGGREHEMMVGQALMATTEKLVTMQGGLDGPFVTASQAYNVVKRFYERALGLKTADPYLGDPTKQPQQPKEPQPDPKMVEVQTNAQIKREEMQLDAQLKREQMAAEMQLKREQMGLEAQLKAAQAYANASMSPVRMGGEVG